jgi:serine/threonine protein kinase
MILHQGLLGLVHLHNLPPNGIVHRDIKPENILLVSRYPFRIKYTDFGVAGDSADLQTFCGTEIYSAPEIWTSSNHSPALDIWSLALVVFELASGLLNRPDKFNYIE